MKVAIAAAGDDDRGPTDPPGYEILDEIGRGGLSATYRARQLSLDRVVAVRVARSDAGSGAAGAALLRDAAVLARVQHPHVVPLIDLIPYRGCDYLVLGYAPGGTLADRLAGGKQLPPHEAAAIAETLARTLAFVHEQGVTHANLKPRNVLLAPGGVPILDDFGLAIDEARRAEMTDGVIVGTPAYMAPEQVRGQVREIGPPADVWALGVVLYEMLAGRPPFRGHTVVDLMTDVVNSPPAPVRTHNPAVSRDLEAVCLRCLQKDPAKRFGSTTELAAALQHVTA